MPAVDYSDVSPVGAAYTTMGACAATEFLPDNVGSDIESVWEYVGDWSSGPDTSNITFFGGNTDETRNVKICTNSANRANGVFDSSKATLSPPSGDGAFELSQAWTVVLGLQIVAEDIFNGVIFYGENGLLDRCHILRVGDSGTGSYNFASNARIRSCVIQDFERNLRAFTSMFAYNNTLIGGFWGIDSGGSNCVAKNNVMFGQAATGITGTLGTGSTNNATGDETGDITITSADFENYAGGEYQPSDGSALIGAGVDLSADSDLIVLTGINWYDYIIPYNLGAYAPADADSASDNAAILAAHF